MKYIKYFRIHHITNILHLYYTFVDLSSAIKFLRLRLKAERYKQHSTNDKVFPN